jgi:phosphatidylinositol glycan class B
MPIEYDLALRSWLQPGIFLIVLRALRGIGMTDPFHQAFVFRLMSSALGFTGAWALVLAAGPWLKTRLQRELAAASLALLWYLPSLHARTSGENWSGAVFFLGLSMMALMKRDWRSFAWGGLLSGLAFELRFQTAFLSLGLFVWWIWIGRARPREWLSFLAAGLVPFSLGFLIDRWGYGYWTWSAWNYLKFTLIQGHSAETSTGPLWDYVRMSFTEAWPGLGTLLFFSFFLAAYRAPKNPIIWSGIPFLLAHHMIAHKELRFLFPLAHAGPVLVALALGEVERIRWRWAARALVAYDLIVLPFQSFLPAFPRIALYRAMFHSDVHTVYYTSDLDDPFSVMGIRSSFYSRPGMRTDRMPPEPVLETVPGPFAIYFLKGRVEPSPGLIARRGCELRVSQLSDFIWARLPRERLPNIKNWQYMECRT